MAGNKNPPKPFVKGDPRINRKGRPKIGQSFAEYVRDFMEAEDEKKGTIVAEMMEIAVKKARQGQFQFWEQLVNRAYGKVPDKVEVSKEDDIDLSLLPDEDLETWKRLLEKAKHKP
jgi:hypothetical protein